LYQKGWRQPTSYIRSSSTVEDCAGTPYDMDEEDEIALKQINLQIPKGVEECSESHFEDVIAFFEETAQNKQPFAAVDSPPVLPLAELEEQYDNTVPPHVQIYAKFIYEHWKARRDSTGNRPIAAQLKGETGADTDEADPYVCFRRREARQVRKTRNRDAHSAEKLRTLRRQLEDARNLLLLVRTRETHRKAVLENDVKLFKQRAEVKDTKRKLGIKGDDEDLVNQKVRNFSSTHLLFIADLA
jgi:enhancer of polycomb-like protein